MMKIRRMQSTAKALAAALLVPLALGACQKEAGQPTTKIITDRGEVELPLVTMMLDEPMWDMNNLRNVLTRVEGSDQEFHVAYDILPMDNPERDTRLTRLQTELMAGKGPDLFISNQYQGCLSTDINNEIRKPMFAFPEQAMENRVFLPLDEYMENARLTDFDRLLPVVMEAGRGEEGQMILPLTYDFGVAKFDREVFDLPVERFSTRQDMLDSGFLGLEYFDGMFRGGPSGPLDYFGQPADYESETLCFTEEELAEQAILWGQTWKRFQAGEFEEVIRKGESNDFRYGGFAVVGNEGYDATDWIVPARNRDGGITAYVQTFAAINRNSPYPEYAFRVLDQLACEATQRDRLIYGGGGGMVTNMDIGSPEDKPISWFPMKPEIYEQYLTLRDEITQARLINALDQTVWEDILRERLTGGLETEEGARQAAHKAYTTMQMLLAES